MFFDTCKFLESVVHNVLQNENTQNFERLLNSYLHEQGKLTTHKTSDFANACDRFLEMCLKNQTIPSKLVITICTTYVYHYSTEKLRNCFQKIISNSLYTNAIVQSLSTLGLSAEVEEEMLTSNWECQIQMGKGDAVWEIVQNIKEEGKLLTLVRMAAMTRDKATRKLIMKSFTAELKNYDVGFVLSLLQVEDKFLWKLMEADLEFRQDLIDATFFFCRHMKQKGKTWEMDDGMTYEHVLKIFKILLNADEKTIEIVRKTMDSMMEMNSDEIWHDLEIDCIW